MAKLRKQHINDGLCCLLRFVLALVTANIHFNRDYRLAVLDPFHAHDLRRGADMLPATMDLAPGRFQFPHPSLSFP
jgi:hypothetical protein